MRILGVCGSLQARSSNLALLQRAAELCPEGVSLELFDGLRHLPAFDPDLERQAPVEPARSWREAIARSDALLVACPEYGFSLPGAVKNAIDWAIISGELEEKVVAVTACVAHPSRGRRGLGALVGTLRAVKALVVGGAPLVRGPDLDGELRALIDLAVEARRAQRASAAGEPAPRRAGGSKEPSTTEPSAEAELRAAVESLGEGPAPNFEDFLKRFAPQSLAPGETFCRRGEHTGAIAFLASGVAHGYYGAPGEGVLSDGLISAPNFLGDLEALLTGARARLSLEALTGLTLWVANFAELTAFLDRDPYWQRVGRRLVEHFYLQRVRRGHMLRARGAVERYEAFRQEHGHLEPRVPDETIALALGIGVEDLHGARRARRDASAPEQASAAPPHRRSQPPNKR